MMLKRKIAIVAALAGILFAVGIGSAGAVERFAPVVKSLDVPAATTPSPAMPAVPTTSQPSPEMPAVPTSPPVQAPKVQSPPDHPATSKPPAIVGPTASPHTSGGMFDNSQGLQAIEEALAVAGILLGIVLWAVYTHQKAKRAEEQRNANKKKKVGRS
jgi:uncharacterized protein HemX